jgi:hypothetical protein
MSAAPGVDPFRVVHHENRRGVAARGHLLGLAAPAIAAAGWILAGAVGALAGAGLPAASGRA